MNIQFAENIKALRKEHEMTQEQLAEALGITVGAVHKWESKQSMPEIKLLIEIADFFETSVDSLIGYTWQNDSVTRIIEKFYSYIIEKNFDEGLRYAEKALKKYPNHFDVLYHAAELYMQASDFDHSLSWRTIELYQDATRLIAQNKQPQISQATIASRIALCYHQLGKNDEAIDILKKNNAERQNEFRIGLILSELEGRKNEALEHLSNSFGDCLSTLCNTSLGYVKVYMESKEYEQLKILSHSLYNFIQSLRDTSKPHYLDRLDISILTVLSWTADEENDKEGAKEYLKRAKAVAARFDASPTYVFTGAYFYYGSKNAVAYDDLGGSAEDIILNFIYKNPQGKQLLPLWEEIRNEA